MESMAVRLLTLTGSVTFLFLLVLTPINPLAIAEIQSSSTQAQQYAYTSPIALLSANASQVGPGIQKSIPSQELSITSSKEFPGAIANGSIGYSVNITKEPKYVAEGKWNLVDDGSNADFSANMTWYPNNALNSSIRQYQIRDFQLQPGQHITVQPNNITIQGNATVLSDGVIKWRSIPISIKIAGYVFDVSFTGNDPNSVTAKRQFGNQDVLGIVKALRECPNQPLLLIPVTC